MKQVHGAVTADLKMFTTRITPGKYLGDPKKVDIQGTIPSPIDVTCNEPMKSSQGSAKTI